MRVFFKPVIKTPIFLVTGVWRKVFQRNSQNGCENTEFFASRSEGGCTFAFPVAIK